ncbi:hypothetical protein [Halobellus marinus]|uniref:hypothetical protein n=1 Tax=Halobellus TaxID=1073986 RepID=UPI0028AC9FAE|nr:hypothetical protein [Halobellus sp. DFY28]
MDRRQFLSTLGAVGVVGAAGCTAEQGVRPSFRVGAAGFERRTDGGYRPLSVRGVNLGMAKPGRFPGEAAITRSEYDRWLASIGEIANVVRTYTIHPPSFYRALAAYNDEAAEPLLLLQGTWVPTAELLSAGDATAISETVDAELDRTVDVVHGDAMLSDRPGHAAGRYDADVSDATLGFLFGIEWPPEVVAETNERGDSSPYAGTYFETTDGTPFEGWLAGRMDRLATREMDGYGVQRPVAFVNWVTADPLDHPYEPFANEDRVSLDPDRIDPTAEFEAGTLASYHVYPYYPDLLNETPEYVQYTDHRGERNNFAGYLNDLVDETDLPVLVSEFGVPSSRGLAHRNVHGRDQGGHTEQEQGEIVAAMFADISHADTAGGIMFAWQNEWFKRTWNLDARSVPGRRPFWSNVETPEQRFGLLAFDPPEQVVLDGSEAGWDGAESVTAAESTDAEPQRTLRELRVTHDVEGLNCRLRFEELPDPVDWTRLNAIITIGLTDRTTALPFGVDAEARADFVVRLAGPTDSRLLVESSYDAFASEFGGEAGLPLEEYRDGRAGFVPVREVINRGYTVPATGEEVPFEAVETGRLRYGNGNPDAESYDSLTDVHVDPASNSIELRLPWILLNVADPSSKQRIATDWEESLGPVPFDGVTLSAGTFLPDGDRDGDAVAVDGPTNLTDQLPGSDGTVLDSVEYTWEPWDQPAYRERLKESYHVLRDQLP